MARENFSEYSRLRDIAVKRSARLEKAGLAPAISFPTVKELRRQGIKAEDALQTIRTFTEAKTTVREYRKLPVMEKVTTLLNTRNRIAAERQKQLKRERNKRYRERMKSLTKKEKALLKAAHTLGLKDVKDIKAFTEYMEMRFAQGNDSYKYKISIYVEDYEALISKKNYTPDQINSDYMEFLLDRSELMEHANDMDGTDFFNGEALFSEFMNEILE